MIDPTRECDVLTGFCHQGTVTTHFMNSLLGAFSADAGRKQRRLNEYHETNGHFIHDNRSRIATYFLEHTNHQWLWFLDVDIQFDRDVIYTMLEAAERNQAHIVAAAYWNRYGKSGTHLSWLAFNEGFHALETLPEEELVEIAACGMGCTLIHRDALQAVSDEWKKVSPGDPWDTFGADLLRSEDDEGNLIGKRIGEDVTFCMRASRVGFPTYGLTTVTVDHFKPAYMQPGGMMFSGV